MKQKTTLSAVFAMVSLSAFAQLDIPQAGSTRVDGRINDWRRPEWFQMNTVINGTPTNLSNVRWTAAWDEDPMIYIAVQYDDADIVLKNGTNAADCVEVYVRGDTGSSPTAYAKNQQSAQSYRFGLAADKTSTWLQMGEFENIPRHNRAKAAVSLENNTFTCEIAVPVYDWFDPDYRHRCSESEIMTGRELGLDIAIIDTGKNKTTGMLGINGRDKRHDANAITEQILDE
ncbi:DOMON domain-containing protein [Tichowtungia aerotolerans]|uniref:Uncharacterized protein n=1 Tax=Tichowtungia aerotolerans TaxID=2697043 RepID=A0A6P1MAE2_9BACT|nr:hypothetical protein [Tichowtungia aerotolerans]QHI70063.1 hypothetical protein GT409_11590 [Tichowtungia aerotolerans]